METQLLASFVVYFAILLTIGLIAHKKHTTASDFMLGSRGLNFYITALSAHASDMSSWLFMAFPAAIFIAGPSAAWIGIGLTVCMFLNWHFVAPKLRKETEKYNSYTLSSYFESRFEDASGSIRLTSALISVVFLTAYLGAGLISMGLLLQKIFFMNYYIGISLATFVVISYTYVGGYVAIAWVDLFQGLFLLLMIVLVPIVALAKIGGFEAITAAAEAKQISMHLLPIISFTAIRDILFISLGWGLGYFGLPHVLTKFMGIRDANEMYKSKWLGITWQFLCLTAAVLVGLTGMAYYSTLPNNELIFVELVRDFFPVFMGGLILCGIIAATISTMDSQILVVSTVISEDFYKKAFHPEATERTILRVSRIGVVAVSIAAYLIALNPSSTIYTAVQYAWSGLGCTFGPPVLSALFLKSVTRQGILAGLIVGGVIGTFWGGVNPYLFSFEIPSMIVGYLGGFFAILTTSFLTSSQNSLSAKVF